MPTHRVSEAERRTGGGGAHPKRDEHRDTKERRGGKEGGVDKEEKKKEERKGEKRRKERKKMRGQGERADGWKSLHGDRAGTLCEKNHPCACRLVGATGQPALIVDVKKYGPFD